MTMHLVSVSGGKDSTATLALAIELHGRENVLAAFADTGNENEATYDYVRYLEQVSGVPIQWLKQDFTEAWWHKREYIAQRWLLPHHNWPNGVPQAAVVRALAVFDQGPTGNPFLDLCIIKGRFPSRMAQFCTQSLKVEPLTGYALDLIEKHGSVWSWQGIRMDESYSRHSRMHISGHMVRSFEVVGGGLYINRPILRWTAADVFEAHRLMGWKPNPLYSLGAVRVGCMPCINAGKDEILNISKRFPEHIDRIAEWEVIMGQVSKRGSSTFFYVPGENETAFERGNVRQVVEWSQTQRGGKSYDWIRLTEEVSACTSSYGLCEEVAA